MALGKPGLAADRFRRLLAGPGIGERNRKPQYVWARGEALN
jgi:hypothetical protein